MLCFVVVGFFFSAFAPWIMDTFLQGLKIASLKEKKKQFYEHRTQVFGRLGSHHGIFSSVLDET